MVRAHPDSHFLCRTFVLHFFCRQSVLIFHSAIPIIMLLPYIENILKNNHGPKQMTERPLECSGCKKEATITYTEIVGKAINSWVMCADCPALQKRLHGTLKKPSDNQKKVGAGVCCGHCGTTLEDIHQGNLMGCQECYNVFADVIASEIIMGEDLSPTLSTGSKHLHIGRGPGETVKINPSARLLALNEALNETLEREDYEQAAWLRDQINAIVGTTTTEKQKESHE